MAARPRRLDHASAPAERDRVEREGRNIRLSSATATQPDVPGWHASALCAQADPEAFFPEQGESTNIAKRICGGCEVREECLAHALGHGERHGVWGGLSETERRELRSAAARRRPSNPDSAGSVEAVYRRSRAG